jgi:hypothetical protein
MQLKVAAVVVVDVVTVEAVVIMVEPVVGIVVLGHQKLVNLVHLLMLFHFQL